MSPSAGEPLAARALEIQAVKRYLRVVAEHVRLIVVCAAITLGCAIAYVKVTKRTYAATAQMLVTPVPTSDSTLVGLPVLYSSGDPTRDVLTASSLITTPEIAQATVDALHLDEPATELLGTVQAIPVGGSNLVGVTATAGSPQQAQAVANEFARQVIDTRAQALTTAIDGLLPGLRAQLASLPASERFGPGSVGAQISELEQLRGSGDPTLTIAAPAVLPSAPASPRTKLTLVAALIAGLLIGVGAAFAFEALDPRIRREEQLRELFEVPVFASVPRERRAARGAPLVPGSVSFATAEGFRTLRTVLSTRARGGQGTFLMTSSVPGEGKTTVAINLAAAIAAAGSRVILIEADLRRPRIAETLKLHPAYGTEDVLSGDISLEDALITVSFDDAPVSVLAVQRPGTEVADRLTVSVARRLLARAHELAEFVVIDSPPATAVSDALPLAQLADEVVLVARLGMSRLGNLSRLHDILYEQGSYPTGIVLVAERLSRHLRSYYTREPARGPLPRRADRVNHDQIEPVHTLPG